MTKIMLSAFFSLHHTALSDKLGKLDSIENAAKQDYKMALQQSHQDDAKVMEVMDNLNVIVWGIRENLE